MPANFERTPRKRTNYHKDTPARRQSPERERVSRARTPERKRVSRTHAPERERVSRTHAPERERASRGRTPERERASRGRTPERERASRTRAPERERVSRGRVTARKAVSYRGRAAARRRIPRRRQRARAGFLPFVSRLAVIALLILSVGKIGSQLFFQELRIVVQHADEPAPEETLPSPLGDTVSQKTLVSDHISAASDRLAAAPDLGRPLSDAARYNRKEGFYTILAAGVDDHNGGSDTVILVSVDAKNHQLFGVSIPRDTKAIVKGNPHKLNAAYKTGGMALLSQTISEQLSIPIDYTVEIDLEGFAALIDAIGGVDFEVPLDMDYEDPKQNLEIHITKGFQHLNGAQALKVVRFRHNSDGSGYGDEDLGRIRTQQNFLKTAAKKVVSFSSLMKLDDMARIFHQYVKTELTLPNLAWLGREALYAGADGIQFATLPGTWKSPYIYTDPQGALDLINAHLNPYKTDRTLEDLRIPS